MEAEGIIAWGKKGRTHSARGLDHHRVPIIIQLDPGEGLMADMKCGPQRRYPEYKLKGTRGVDWRLRGGLGPLVLPLTLVDVLERTSPTEFHADPELLQPTGGQESRDNNDGDL